MIFFRLFYEFFKVGLFAFGGALATIPFLAEMADRTGWFTQDLLANMIAVAESTPGPIGVNTATYVGYTVAGTFGGIAATLGIATPSILIALLVAGLLKAYRQNRYVDSGLRGIRPASVGLIAAAGLGILKLCFLPEATGLSAGILSQIRWKGVVLAVVIWVLTNRVKQTKKLHPGVFLAISAAVGIIFRFAEV